MTCRSRPPTISRVGAFTSARESGARSGRPPRETTAFTSFGRCAAALRAAAAPVLAPNRPTGRLFQFLFISHPGETVEQPLAQQIDVEDFLSILRLPFVQKIRQQGGDPCRSQGFGDKLIPRAESAAPAAVCKEDHPFCLRGQIDISLSALPRPPGSSPRLFAWSSSQDSADMPSASGLSPQNKPMSGWNVRFMVAFA